jgi:alkanesulfonate monooxygenase SsuD/methylene tetrahydromethanopterin reductase-like flavin-dependent oxidoreductase (luciferase family)
MRQMTLVAFLQAQNCTNFVGSWRHPEASPDFMTADYYRHIARVLEAGKFHVGFFDDRLAMPDRYSDNHAHTVANGIRCVKRPKGSAWAPPTRPPITSRSTSRVSTRRST